MGLFMAITELLGRLTILTPLLERFVGSGKAGEALAIGQMQRSVADLSAAQSELSESLVSSYKDQQIRLSRLEEVAARVANRLAELVNDREKLEVDVNKLHRLLRLVLILCLVLLVVSLATIGFLVFRLR